MFEERKSFHTKQGSRKDEALSHNVFTPAEPLLRLSQLVGLAPVVVPGFQSSTFGVLYSLIMFTALLAWFIYTTFLSIKHEYPGKSATFIVPDLFYSATLYITSLVSLMLCVLVIRNKSATTMHLLVQVESMMSGFSISMHKRMRLIAIIEIVIVMVTLSSLAVYDNVVWTGKLWNFHNYTGRYIAHLINVVLVLQFSNLALLLKQRFAKLNDILRYISASYGDGNSWLLKANNTTMNAQPFNTFMNGTFNLNNANPLDEKNSVFGSFHIKRTSTNINSGILPLRVHPIPCPEDLTCQKLFLLRKVHAILCEVVTMVNGMYGIQILFAITSEFIGLVWLLYLLLVTCIETDMTENQQQSVILYIFWLLFRFLKILCIVGSCHMAQTEAKCTGKLVNHLMLQEESHLETGKSPIFIQLQLFSQQLLHSHFQVDFTACGFFPLDMTLVHSVIGAVTTYIIILIQFYVNNHNIT